MKKIRRKHQHLPNVYYTHRMNIQIKSKKNSFYLTTQPVNDKLILEEINGRPFFEKCIFSHYLTSELSRENSIIR